VVIQQYFGLPGVQDLRKGQRIAAIGFYKIAVQVQVAVVAPEAISIGPILVSAG
jgi:hypothetical protein